VLLTGTDFWLYYDPGGYGRRSGKPRKFFIGQVGRSFRQGICLLIIRNFSPQLLTLTTMKKTLLVLLMITIGGAAWAQKANKKNREIFTLGPKAGINYTTLIKDDRRLSSDYQLGYHFGGFLRLSPGKFYVQPELLLTSKKTDLQVNQNTGGTVQSGSYQVSFTNVDVPLLFGTKLLGTRTNFRVFAGPMASFNISGRGLEDVFRENTSAQDYYEKTIWGFQAGAGIDLGALTFDARYERGLSAAANLERANLGKPATGLFQFSLGIKLL